MFVLKTEAELTAMTPEQRDAYAVAKQKHDSEVIEKTVKETVEKTTKEINEALNEIGSKVNGLSEKSFDISNVAPTSLEGAILKALEENKDKIDAVLNGDTKRVAIEIKTGTIGIGTSIGAGATQNSISQFTGLISPIRQRAEVYLQNVSRSNISTSIAYWIEETTPTGTPIMLAEGASRTQLDVEYVEKTMSVKEIGVYGKVTDKLIADAPQLVGYIQNNLMKRMDLKLEDQLIAGNGTGNNISGATNYATAFTGAELATTKVPSANEFDVLEALALQVKEGFGEPTGVFIHPSTLAQMKLIKDANKRPVWKDYVTITGDLIVSGMKVIESIGVTAGTFIGGDLSNLHVVEREGLSIEIGLDGNDFTTKQKTILLNRRMCQYVSANDVQTLITGTFSTAKALITV